MWAEDQWRVFCALIDSAWPGDFEETDRQAYRILLDDVQPDRAMLAVKTLMHSGARFRPSVSEILAQLRTDPSRPTFDEAYPSIYRAAARQQLPEAHPLVVSFIERQGLQRLGRLPLDDPEWGEKHRRDLRDAWDRHCLAMEGRETLALATGRDGLRRLDPAGALPRLEAPDAGR